MSELLIVFTMPTHRPEMLATIDIDTLTNVMFLVASIAVLVSAAMVVYALWLVTEIRRRLRELYSRRESARDGNDRLRKERF